MTMPASLLADGVEKSLRNIHKELRERLEGNGYVMHDGIPSPDFAFDDKVGAWVAPTNMDLSEADSSWNAASYVSTWLIHIIRPETSGTTHDVDYFELYRDTGKFIESLAGTTADMGLDGAVDFIVEPNVQFAHVPTQDKTCIAAVFTLQAHHFLEPVRC